LPGKVHGVVVQITTDALSNSFSRRANVFSSRACAKRTGNFTHTMSEV
jgi:hypothetical protein